MLWLYFIAASVLFYLPMALAFQSQVLLWTKNNPPVTTINLRDLYSLFLIYRIAASDFASGIMGIFMV